MTMHGASRRLDNAIVAKHRLGVPRLPHINLTLRLFILVLIAVLPAIVIQGYNEYDLRKAREADIRQQVIQITKQFGEEIGELREGARQLLLAKSFLFFYGLQDRYGAKVFHDAIGHMLYARASRGFELDDLIAAFEQETHQNVAEFVRLWMKHPGIPADFRARYENSAAAATRRGSSVSAAAFQGATP